MRIFSLLRKIFLWPFSLVYHLLYLFDRSSKLHVSQKATGAVVISVGNITTGGTGKTPLVKLLCSHLKKSKPVILTRGYGSKSGPAIINRKSGGDLTRFGDEPALLALETGCEISCDPNRFNGILRTGHKQGLYIMDDGFQHYALARDLDIVILDATDPFGGNMLLPAGNLREPVSSLRRADLVVINRVSMINAIQRERIIHKLKEMGISGSRIFQADTTADRVTDCHGRHISVENLEKSRVLAFAGIGNFGSFKAMVEKVIPSGKIRTVRYPDHHPYSQKDIRDLQKHGKSHVLLTTMKDFVKLKGRLNGVNILHVQMVIRDKKRFFSFLPG